MNRSTIWFAVVVALAAGAAMLAFLVAAPSPKAPVVGPKVGFQQLQPAYLTNDARRWSNSYREQYLKQVMLMRASASARSWLAGVAGSRSDQSRMPRQVVLGKTGPGASRIAWFVTWADDLPPTVWTVGAPRVTLSGSRLTGRVVARSVVTVRMAQAANMHRDVRIATTIVMAPVGGTATEAATNWTIVDIKTPPVRGLRTLHDPIIVHRPHADVYADRRLTDEAVRVADHAEVAMPYLRDRYPNLATSDVVGIYLLDNDQQARAVLGKEAESTDKTIGRALAWTYETGDVVLDWSRLQGVDTVSRLGTVRHELTHVVTRNVITTVPTLLMEGIAVREETKFVTRGTTLRPDFTSLRAAIAGGTLKYQQLLHSTDSSFGRSSSDEIDVAYQVSSATVAYIEDTYDHAALVRLLQRMKPDGGLDRALAAELRVGPAEFERRLLIWLQRHPDGL